MPVDPISQANFQSQLREFVDLSRFSNAAAVTLTMKKRFMGANNDPSLASSNLQHFLNRLNHKLLGSRAKRYGEKLPVFAVLERNADDRLHYHAIIDRPTHCSFERFRDCVGDAWRSTNFGYDQIDVQDSATSGWVDYMLKFRQKTSLLDSIDWNN
jgi:hypothetical protein